MQSDECGVDPTCIYSSCPSDDHPPPLHDLVPTDQSVIGPAPEQSPFPAQSPLAVGSLLPPWWSFLSSNTCNKTNGQVPSLQCNPDLVSRTPLTIKRKRLVSNHTPSQKCLKVSGGKKRLRSGDEIDYQNQNVDGDIDATNVSNRKDNGNDAGPKVILPIPRLEVQGDKEVCHTIFA